MTVLIRNADWSITWDGTRHVYRRGVDIAFDDQIRFIGQGYDGPADETIDGRGRMVMPGFVNIHTHPTSEPLNKGLLEERGSPMLGMSALYEFMAVLRPDEDARRAAARFAMAEMIRSGVTTFCDFTLPRGRWVEDVAATGLRAYLCPAFRAARWSTDNGHSVDFAWDLAAGRDGLQAALAIVDEAMAHPSGRISGMVGPQQSDTCDEALMHSAAEAANSRGIPLHTHAGFAVVEFNEMIRRHGLTPIGWLDAIGVLKANTVLAHCIFVDEYDWVVHHERKDVDRLAHSGATVVHCPAIYARRGIVMRDFGSYLRRGVRMAIATDSFPHDMVDEMRWAAVLSKVMSRNVEATSVAEIFDAATIGGASAVGRDDIGRIAVGAKADLVLADLSDPSLQPLYDPLRSLVFSGLNRPFTDSWVDGRRLMRDRELLTIDIAEAVEGLNSGQRRTLDRVHEHDPQRRLALEMFPLSLPTV